MWNVNNEEKRMRSRKLQAAQLQADRARESPCQRARTSPRASELCFWLGCHRLHGCHDGFESARVKEQLLARLVAVGGGEQCGLGLATHQLAMMEQWRAEDRGSSHAENIELCEWASSSMTGSGS